MFENQRVTQSHLCLLQTVTGLVTSCNSRSLLLKGTIPYDVKCHTFGSKVPYFAQIMNG